MLLFALRAEFRLKSATRHRGGCRFLLKRPPKPQKRSPFLRKRPTFSGIGATFLQKRVTEFGKAVTRLRNRVARYGIHLVGIGIRIVRFGIRENGIGIRTPRLGDRSSKYHAQPIQVACPAHRPLTTTPSSGSFFTKFTPPCAQKPTIELPAPEISAKTHAHALPAPCYSNQSLAYKGPHEHNTSVGDPLVGPTLCHCHV